MHVGSVSSPPLHIPDALRQPGPAGVRSTEGIPFAQLMSQLLQAADQPQQVVIQGMDQILTGQVDNIHDLAINVANADVAFRIVMEVRDQLISAYQEVMRMQV